MATLAARDLVNVPGLLSLSRLPLAVAFALTLEHHPAWGLGILAAAGVTDVVDGWYARRFHKATATGALLDGVMDKVFVLAVVVSLLLGERLSPGEAVAFATRDVGEAALAIYIAARGRAFRSRVRHSNLAGKLTTLLQVTALFAVLFGWHALPWIIACAVMGAVAAATYWARELRAK